MKIKAQLQEANFQLALDECIIEKTVSISQTRFLMFMSNYNMPQSFIQDNLDVMCIDDDNVYHCLMVQNESTNEGVVVFSDEAFAKRTAYIEDVTTLDNKPLPKPLSQFVGTMLKAKKGIVLKAVEDNDQGQITLSRDYIEENFAEGYPINMYMLKEMLLECDEFKSITLDSDNLNITTDNIFANYPYARLDESDYSDMEVMLAKHTLWVYDAGGERLDLEDMHIENMSLVGKNFNGAHIRKCTFKNCDFSDAEFCFADLSNTTFDNCTFNNVVAEEANCSGVLFEGSEIHKCTFTHANFKDACVHWCDVESLNLISCCIENFDTETIDDSDIDLSNAYQTFDEYEASNNPNLTMGDE